MADGAHGRRHGADMSANRHADTTPTRHLRSRHGAMSPTWSVSCRQHSADMSACLSFWGGKIPDTTPTFPAKQSCSSFPWPICDSWRYAWLEMSASCRGFFPPKTTDMPTCRRCVADTTQTMSATLPSVGSSDAVFVSCRHDNLPTCRQETTKSTIVRYDIMQ